jgi:GalNAc-alpha-(1->4)-GalNAc-alpha-(1->3)-diNAcBac-PP-undecaprenol alpha-1,4-N-acetyl-D-galactosaminyltransferase
MERVMSVLADHFSRKAGIELHLVLYGHTRELFYPLPASISLHIPEFPFNNDMRLVSTIRTLHFLRKKVKEISPNTVLSFGEFWNNFVLLATLGLDIPVFVSDRSQPDKSLGRLHDFLRKRLYPTAYGVIVQTEKAKAIYEAEYRLRNMKVIGNPIRFVDRGRRIARENVVLMVGRLIKSKHQDKLIEIFANTDNSDWKLVLVGYDHLQQQNMSRLRELASSLGIENKVILAGKQSDVDRYYLSSKIFAFTSSSEGFPNVIGEAMSADLPVVSFDCVAGPSDLIDDGETGFLVPLFDSEAFRKRLAELMKDADLRERMGQLGGERIRRYSVENIGECFLEFITSPVRHRQHEKT